VRGRAGRASVNPVLFHPDYTVGSGVTPDLLTLRFEWSPIRTGKVCNFS
jgi:hypothetical protein